MLNVMLPTRVENWPDRKNGWLYETKYDGFRCRLEWNEDEVRLISRNGLLLNDRFPEITAYCKNCRKPPIPVVLDGELSILLSNYTSDFSQCQKRGRMRSKTSVTEHAALFPAVFLAFDLLILKGRDMTGLPFIKRKASLQTFLSGLGCPLEPEKERSETSPLQMIPVWKSPDKLWNQVQSYNGEGIVAKKEYSKWMPGRTMEWQKIKNYKSVHVLITGEKKNGYFKIGVESNDMLKPYGSFSHGLSSEERDILKKVIRKNSKHRNGEYDLAAPLCCEVKCLGTTGKELREPRFSKFLPHEDPSDYTVKRLNYELEPLPPHVNITKPEKLLFPKAGITKRDYIYYLQKMAPFILSWLYNRPLTVIRFPDGIEEESFYQKNAPPSLPSFVETRMWEGHHTILVNNIETLLWLGNQGAIEFHIPPEKADGDIEELFLDLDPPDRKLFPYAVRAALDVKEILNKWQLYSFVKTSGRKGLQIYIPVSKGSITYEEGNVILSFLASALVELNPAERTVERLKKKRNDRLYIDFLQHGKGKTIIAPYSLRAVPQGLAAYPVQWSDVDNTLDPAMFTLDYALSESRVKPLRIRGEDRNTNSSHLRILIHELAKQKT
ncbi:DNA ligase D [Bacillus sp. H-16]|uniref:DNA ligase D n=1 Tax=Alteribacter salitolerans TaxID=2912333 RepID=UPI0019660A09|nr:DNA ligase D [Alteribacter salitolerans]MBM7094534.1 DNA ligase D [Alteribacter salitolerans]